MTVFLLGLFVGIVAGSLITCLAVCADKEKEEEYCDD